MLRESAVHQLRHAFIGVDFAQRFRMRSKIALPMSGSTRRRQLIDIRLLETGPSEIAAQARRSSARRPLR
jgi:hypothetical protein